AADMIAKSRTGFLEQGLLVRDYQRTKALYKKSWAFRFDVASIIPIDYIVFAILGRPYSVARLTRLFRI
ncbi:hypothetical protein PENTCL1PPCAC_11869, partial [Pristionchus entomophagus]